MIVDALAKKLYYRISLDWCGKSGRRFVLC